MEFKTELKVNIHFENRTVFTDEVVRDSITGEVIAELVNDIDMGTATTVENDILKDGSCILSVTKETSGFNAETGFYDLDLTIEM